MLQILLNADANIFAQNWTSGSALACAAEHNTNPEITKFLIKNGLSVHDENLISEMTPLMIAVQNNNFEIAKLLIEYGADIDVPDNAGYSALDYANADKHNVSFAEFLKQRSKKNSLLDLSDKVYHQMTAVDALAYLSKENAQNESTINDLLAALTPREERVIRLWFGIGVQKAQTLCEIGQLFNVSAKRVGQVMSKALIKLQNSPLWDNVKKISILQETPEALLARFVQYNNLKDNK